MMDRTPRKFYRLGWLSAALLLGSSACGRPTEPSLPLNNAELPARSGEALQTDLLSYTATYRSGEGAYRTYAFRVITTFTNPLGVTVYLQRCSPNSPTPIYGVELVGDKTGPDGWGSAFNHPWGCAGHNQQFVVTPGATRVDTLELFAPGAWQGGLPRGTLEGRMRLRYGVSTCPGDGGCPGVEALGFSNPFDIRLAP